MRLLGSVGICSIGIVKDTIRYLMIFDKMTHVPFGLSAEALPEGGQAWWIQDTKCLGWFNAAIPFLVTHSPNKSVVFISPSMITAPCGPNFRLGEMLVLDRFEYWKSSRHLKATIFGAMRKWCIMNTNPERYRYCFFSNFSLTSEWIQLWTFHYLQV